MQRHPGDARDLGPISGVPSGAPPIAVRDVLVAPTTHIEGDFLHEMPAGEPSIAIGDDMTVERLPHEDVELVMNACTPRGHFFYAVRQFAQRYSFVRRM